MTPPSMQPIPGLKILLVEDNPPDQTAFRRAMAPFGARVDACSSGEEVLGRGDGLSEYDLIVADQGLPGVSGLELCREILAHPDCPPVVVLTGAGSERLAADFLRLGVSDYLIKDVNLDYLDVLPIVTSRTVERHRDRLRHRRGEERLIEEGVRRKALLDSLPVGVYVVDREFRIVEMNRTAEAIVGLPMEQAVGRPCREVIQGDMCGPDCPLRQALSKRDTLGPLDGELVNPRGEVTPINYTATAIQSDDGSPLGGVAVFQDVTMLKALEQVRASMLSMLAHDMKTPLVGIRGFSRLLQDEDQELSSEKRRSYIEVVHTEAEQLDNLVSDFLESAREGLSDLRLNLSDLDLGSLLREMAGHYAAQSEQLGVSIRTELPPAAVPARGDPERLTRALRNLIDNAFSHSPRGGVVTLRLAEEAGDIRIEVCDQGPGIDSDDLPQLFSPFFRGKRSSPTYAGYGLGLVGVKAILESHGGKVTVANNSDQGCTFRLSLPRPAVGV